MPRQDCFLAIPSGEADADITIVGNTIDDMKHYIDLLWNAVDSGDPSNIPQWMKRWLQGEETIVYPNPHKGVCSMIQCGCRSAAAVFSDMITEPIRKAKAA